MKKFYFLLVVGLLISISLKAQYSNATLSGPWFIYTEPLNPFEEDGLMYIVFDGNGNITDFCGFGEMSGTYTVSSSGAIDATLMADDESIPFTGQLTSETSGSILVMGEMTFTLVKISNPGALSSSISGILTTTECGQRNVTLTINNQGIISEAIGLTGPVTGRVYADLGVFAGHFKTGESNGWGEINITGYYTDNTLIGEVGLDWSSCGTTSVQMTHQNTVGIDDNTNSEITLLYPNPSKDYFYLIGIESNNYEIQIRDISGKLLLNNQINKDEPIAIHHLPVGIYLVKIVADETETFKKLIKI
jgi:hypothetical protein